MAQTIHCDVHNREHPADVLVSQIANGDTMAACFPGYVELARALVADAEVKAAEALAAELATPAAAEAATEAEVNLADAEVERRLAGLAPSGTADVIADAELEARQAEPPRSPEAEALGVAAVVPKGTSRSRKAHQARQRASRARVAPKAAPEAAAAPGPPSAPTDDQDGGAAPA